MRKKPFSGISKRNTKAASLIEMAMGLIVLLPVLLTIMDLTVITLAVQINDNAAREAVRLAASGDPGQAQARAQQVIARINKSTSGYVSNITLTALTFKPTTLLANAVALVPYGGTISGSVTVQTQATVTPFVVQYVYPGPYNFNSAQTCPITYTVPNTAGGQTIAP
ncbi:MAG: TadE/TadG family type IV pilus assembly protein [Candidatus Obscuribacterales bacterium]|nr:TadE/TadG family type IV pilus assembly protein [Candidatus Obscuribacterales bacterium]